MGEQEMEENVDGLVERDALLIINSPGHAINHHEVSQSYLLLRILRRLELISEQLWYLVNKTTPEEKWEEIKKKKKKELGLTQ